MNPPEKIAMWLTRLILAPFALILGWSALGRFASAPSEDLVSPIGASSIALELFLAGLLTWAVFYPAPPWRNVPLRRFLFWVFAIVLVAAWLLASIFIALAIALWLYGEPFATDEPKGVMKTIVFLIIWIPTLYLLWKPIHWLGPLLDRLDSSDSD